MKNIRFKIEKEKLKLESLKKGIQKMEKKQKDLKFQLQKTRLKLRGLGIDTSSLL